jgi:hypothetical protein
MVPQQFYVVIPEYRYHLMKNTMAFMWGILRYWFNFKKWNYLNTDNYEKALVTGHWLSNKDKRP